MDLNYRYFQYQDRESQVRGVRKTDKRGAISRSAVYEYQCVTMTSLENFRSL